jgi:arsenate reductase
VAYTFHDYKVDAPTPALLDGWADTCGWEPLLNRAGTTFRQLPDRDKQDLTRAKAFALMLAQPSIIKRPVLDVGGKITVGFSPAIYAELFGTAA